MGQQQPYDSSIKAIFNEDAPAILPLLLPGIEVLEVLDVEILRSPMRADRVYRVLYRGKPHTFHLEFQASRDDKMAFRMAVYHTQLLEKYELPVISMVVYLFKTTVVTSPLQEFSGTEELLRFNFRVLPIWDMDGRQYVEQHKVSMYTLLPMMQNINDTMLLQAIDELIEYGKGDASKLERRLLYGGPLCQDTKVGITKSYFPPFQLLCSHCHLLTPVGSTLRQVFGNQGLDADVRDYKM